LFLLAVVIVIKAKQGELDFFEPFHGFKKKPKADEPGCKQQDRQHDM
jgi:hypothetical protein